MTALDTNVLIYDSVKPRSRAADATVLPLIEDQSYRPRLVVIREAPPRPPALRVRHGRHRIPLSEDVHQTGSSPRGGRQW